MESFINSIFEIKSNSDFEEKAIKIFNYQYKNNPVYQNFTDNLKINPHKVKSIRDIPFLPANFYKTHEIKAGDFKAETVFESSMTKGSRPSKHYVKDLNIYKRSIISGFRYFYGAPSGYAIFGLMPSYIERENASLIYMTDLLISQNPDNLGGFYRKKNKLLDKEIEEARKKSYKIIIFGVSFALLDLKGDYEDVIVIETGGMKGRRKEMIREELHKEISVRINPRSIHSEYGMTELLSQAYSFENGKFSTPPWIKIYIRDIHDPFQLIANRQQGLINIIDLANIYSCSFIATDDLGIKTNEGFKVTGRLDNSDIRGCNLMA